MKRWYSTCAAVVQAAHDARAVHSGFGDQRDACIGQVGDMDDQFGHRRSGGDRR